MSVTSVDFIQIGQSLFLDKMDSKKSNELHETMCISLEIIILIKV